MLIKGYAAVAFIPFVALDGCSVMADIRQVGLEWEFVGECDNANEQNGGFILSSISKAVWTVEQTDRHYEKCITEMISMASAK